MGKLNKIYRIYKTEGSYTTIKKIQTHLFKTLTKELNRVQCKYKGEYYKMRWENISPNPSEVIFVSPHDIKFCAPTLVGPTYSLFQECCHIVDGDWDQQGDYEGIIYKRQFKSEPHLKEPQLIPFEQYAFYISLRKHFEENISWEETEMYKWAINNLDASGRYDSVEDVQEWFEYIDDLYIRIKENGYYSQEELIEENYIDSSDPYPEFNEVTVNITRDGEFILGINGRHRLCIAKILNIEKIPVRVFSRHLIWQEVRNRHYNNDGGDKYKHHPDIPV